MKKLFSFLFTILFTGIIFATEVTWPNTTAIPGTETSINGDENVTIKVSSTNTYTSPLRIYANTTITINVADGYTIDSVTYEASSTGNYVTNAQNATVTPNVTPTVNGKKVTWVFTSTTEEFTFKPSVQTRSNGITVAYSSTGGAQSCETPTFNPEGGTYTSTQSVTISCETDGATIYYTVNGDTPTNESVEYTSAINVSSTTTIKAIAIKDGMINSHVASAVYNIVTINHSGTESDPYTVADARNAIDINGEMTNKYAKGIVSQVDSYNDKYKSITYWISDDGTTTDQLQVYSGLDVDSLGFSSIEDINVGDTVVVKGTLKKYNSKYEFDKNNYLISKSSSIVIPDSPAELPFSFDGGKANIESTTGIYQYSLGNDYANSPKLKFDNTGDSVVIYVVSHSKKLKLSYDIKGNSFSEGTFTVQQSVDRSTYTDVVSYTELSTTQSETNTLSESTRYIKFVYTEKVNGNVALGNIYIQEDTSADVNQPENSKRIVKKIVNGQFIIEIDGKTYNMIGQQL